MTNSEVRDWYLAEIKKLDSGLERRGATLEERAKAAWSRLLSGAK